MRSRYCKRSGIILKEMKYSVRSGITQRFKISDINRRKNVKLTDFGGLACVRESRLFV